jgi:hypothetical protein
LAIEYSFSTTNFDLQDTHLLYVFGFHEFGSMVKQTDSSGYIALSPDTGDINDVDGLGVSATEPLLSSGSGRSTTPYGGSVTVHADGQGYTYSYGPGGLSGLIHNYYALGCAIFASIGGM